MRKFSLIASILQISIGVLAIVAFIIVACNNEKILKWIPALILAVFLVASGILGIVQRKGLK